MVRLRPFPGFVIENTMFEFVRRHTRLMQFVLLLLIFPSFVFFGVQGYSDFAKEDNSVASVDGQPISLAEYQNALRMQEERVRGEMQQLPEALRQKLIDSPEFRQQALDGLLRERVLTHAVDALQLHVPDSRLKRLFESDPQLAPIRDADGTLSQEFLSARGLTSAAFAEQLRQEYAVRQVLAGIAGTAPDATTSGNLALDALVQRREIQTAVFDLAAYRAAALPTAADLQKFFDDPLNADRFQAPEVAKVEYVMLDLEALKSGVAVTEAEARKFYEEQGTRFQRAEERRASHILVKLSKGAAAAEVEAARAKAQGLLDEVRRKPGSFGQMARQHSEDVGSAANDGDLDFFDREAMTKPFSDAVFAMKPGEISGLVQTDFGFHIIQLTGVRGGEKRPFESVRAEIEEELRSQQARRLYAQSVEQFTNTVYEQSDSLKPVAEALNLPIRTTTLSRPAEPGMPAEMNNPRFLQAVFDPNNIRLKRNTEAMDLGGNKLVSARVVEHQPPRKRPFAEVRELVRELWVTRKAADLARADAQRQMDAWKQDAARAKLGAPIVVSRNAQLPETADLLQPVLRVAADSLPAWLLVDRPGTGTIVVRVNRVEIPEISQQERDVARSQFARLWGAAESEAYYAALKARLKAELKPAGVSAVAGGASAP